jgi:hypothetical protein
MVTDRQARRLMKELGRGIPLSSAALRSAMSENTARRYRTGVLPSQRKQPRLYRTRPDPFVAVWPEIEALLKEAPGLEAVTIFETIGTRPDASFTEGQLRTLQRKIRRWRATEGPEREVMFAQKHRPGEYSQSDFTSMDELGITIGGEAFSHLYYHFVLPYSNWETGGICFSESFEALIAGLQAALWVLGRAPRYHRTDNLSAATHELGDGGRAFNDRYVGALGHYGMVPDKNTPGRGHENGDVEQAHHRFKRAIEQALLLRGSREFDSRASYECFLRGLIAGRNRLRAGKFQEELARMHDLPLTRLDDFRQEQVLVSRFSTIRVAGNNYSVASRLIGENVKVRLYPERIEVFYAEERVAEMERLRGKGGAAIDYRHIIWSLVRKPGAFARYRWREALFPTLIFRCAFDALERHRPGRADVEYVRILHLAASTSEADVEAVLARLLEIDELRDYAQVRDAVHPAAITTPAVEIAPVCLEAYDACLTAGGEL